jgi:hypothetical protein
VCRGILSAEIEKRRMGKKRIGRHEATKRYEEITKKTARNGRRRILHKTN